MPSLILFPIAFAVQIWSFFELPAQDFYPMEFLKLPNKCPFFQGTYFNMGRPLISTVPQGKNNMFAVHVHLLGSVFRRPGLASRLGAAVWLPGRRPRLRAAALPNDRTVIHSNIHIYVAMLHSRNTEETRIRIFLVKRISLDIKKLSQNMYDGSIQKPGTIFKRAIFSHSFWFLCILRLH